jgi:hypothetical protein
MFADEIQIDSRLDKEKLRIKLNSFDCVQLSTPFVESNKLKLIKQFQIRKRLKVKDLFFIFFYPKGVQKEFM